MKHYLIGALCALSSCACSAPVFADAYQGNLSSEPNIRWVDGDVDLLGTFVFTNGNVIAPEGHPRYADLVVVYHQDTPEGRVSLRVTSTTNSLCSTPCPDTYEVVDWPAGYMPDPLSLVVAEQASAFINIVLYQGF